MRRRAGSPHIRAPMRSSCAASCAAHARTRAALRTSATVAPIASCSSSFGRREPMVEAAVNTSTLDAVRVGLVSVSDRASSGVYQDQGIPSLQGWLQRAVRNPIEWETRLVADEELAISAALIELVDERHCDLVLTTGGTGPAPRDGTPAATLAIASKVMPGFGEQMRQISLKFVPTAILSRQVAVIRGRALIINLPGQPKAIAETLAGHEKASGIFAAVP